MQKTSIICKYFVVLLMVVVATRIANAQKFSLSGYISEHKEAAQELMVETGVPASVILGVAIHESAYGNSKIAKHLNNHFGIKGKNHSKVIRSAYKGYPSVKESYRDFVGLLQRRKATSRLFDKYAYEDFHAWVKGIARAGYSETGAWSSKVLSIIQRYKLGDIDAEVNSNLEYERLAAITAAREEEDLLLQQMSQGILEEDVFAIVNMQIITPENLDMDHDRIKSWLSATNVTKEQENIL